MSESAQNRLWHLLNLTLIDAAIARIWVLLQECYICSLYKIFSDTRKWLTSKAHLLALTCVGREIRGHFQGESVGWSVMYVHCWYLQHLCIAVRRVGVYCWCRQTLTLKQQNKRQEHVSLEQVGLPSTRAQQRLLLMLLPTRWWLMRHWMLWHSTCTNLKKREKKLN